MKISTKGRYATRAMLDLALHYGKTPVLLKDISARQDISLRYLEQIISPLIAAKLIKSTRGPRGGIALAKPPRKIKLLDIIQVLEGPVAPVECVENPGVCTRAPSCAARDVWTDLARAMHGVLDSTTLQDLVERQREKEPGKELLYQI
ncbi:MAG: Rrf2 family transcriptional regulator [Dehalococcoidia bacterium]|jgi:Rrf2 family protein